ncbi:MAG: hypothetical protein IPJ03_22165 [Ignavibacteriales bacterium]|nr:hypothetical protein [Ignavibacteriales bacterium]
MNEPISIVTNEGMINKIMNEDCIQTMGKMPDKSIDLVITSPPYNFDAGSHIGHKYNGKLKDNLSIDDYYNWQKQCITEMIRVSEKVLNSQYEFVLVFSEDPGRKFETAYFNRGELSNLWYIRKTHNWKDEIQDTEITYSQLSRFWREKRDEINT